MLGGLIDFPGWLALEHWLAHTLGKIEAHGFLWLVAEISFALALLGLGLAWLIYGRKPLVKDQPDPLQKGLGPVYNGMANKWWVDEFYGLVILTPYRAIAQFFAGPVDLGVIDGAGNGLAKGTNSLGAWLRRFQNGYVRSYALWMLIGLVAVMTYLVLR